MNIIQSVYESMKWKKTDSYCAGKLGIMESDYRKIKNELQQVSGQIHTETAKIIQQAVNQRMLDLDDTALIGNYVSELESQVVEVRQENQRLIEEKVNLDAGTAEYKAICDTEPKTSEQIMQALRIDQDKWKLSTYWNKQQPNGTWLVSALVSARKLLKEDYLSQVLQNYTPSILPLAGPDFINQSFSEDPCTGILSVQDLHFGKIDNDNVGELYLQALQSLLFRSYHSHTLKRIVMVLGGDLLNADTFTGTTTSGTPLENGLTPLQAYTDAFDTKVRAINLAAQFCEELIVVYLPGNHDRLSSFHLMHGISKLFANQPKISFLSEYSERKVVAFGNNFVGFEHGDVALKHSPLVFATEFAPEWGRSTFRRIYTGHFHKSRKIEYVVQDEVNGIEILTLPSLSSSDYYHKHNKWTGNHRRAVMDVCSDAKGQVASFVYIPSLPKVL